MSTGDVQLFLDIFAACKARLAEGPLPEDVEASITQTLDVIYEPLSESERRVLAERVKPILAVHLDALAPTKRPS